ncbi:MAG: signal peptide peptidase SppA [Spirochaetales bacterium]|nr:signal peptide peptidase SppA [Spirochaetales bacterium]
MKKIIILLFFLFYTFSTFSQEEATVYKRYTDYLLAPPGQMDIGLYGFINPAVLAYAHGFDALFAFSGPLPDFTPVSEWGLFMAIPGLGFGTIRTEQPDETWTGKYRLSFGYGTNALSIGLGYEWSDTDEDNLLAYGMLSRPLPYLSFGFSGYTNLAWDRCEIALELGIRPFGNDILTLYSDYALLNPGTWGDFLEGTISLGLVTRLPFLKGFYITGRYSPTTGDLSFGCKISTGNISPKFLAHLDDAVDFSRYTCSIRTGLCEPNLLEQIDKGNSYLLLTMNGYLDYQVRSLFYKSQTLLDVICSIQKAKTDTSIAGIIIDTSGFYTDRQKLWEIREALLDFKSSGKKVVVYLESADIDMYLFASLADSIVCDPLGVINLNGYILGMSYYKGLLDKAGIGFEELRLYKYKSANEQFSRKTMSDAQREQIEAYIEDIYTYTLKEIAGSRGIPEADLNRFVNEISFFTAQEALSNKLIDATGRFEKAKEAVKKIEGREMNFIYPGSLPELNRPYIVNWGSRKKIAVIYALGICDMEAGIGARYLASDIDTAGNDPAIKAVVIRVDSPGGSAIASDIIADAVKRCRKHKPVVISQGFVAASGGYWISFCGDVIVAGPQTLTGSIGVAGGWFYDNGLKEKLGITTDYVKKGEYADFGFGLFIPYIYMNLPDRNLNEAEREMFEKYMAGMYEDFITKVAEEREMSKEKIEEIAQGRIWSGIKAKELGLVDEIGGLARAITIAKEKAGIPGNTEVDIIEFPRFDPFSLYRRFIDSFSLTVRKGQGTFMNNNRASTMLTSTMLKSAQHLLSPNCSKKRGEVQQYSMPYHMADLFSYRIKHNGKPLPIIDVYTLDMLIPYFFVQEKAFDSDG